MSMNEIRQVVRSEILLEYVAAMNEEDIAVGPLRPGDDGYTAEFSAHITDKATGDAFRAWVTTNYAEVAEVADLDAEGPWNNQFIRKVWDVLADAYIAADKQDIEAPDSNTSVLNNISTALTDFINGLEDPAAAADGDAVADAVNESVIREIFGRGHILSEAVVSDVAKMTALKVAAAGGDTEAADKIIDMRMIMRPAIEQLQGLFTDNEGHTNDPEIVSIASGMDGSLAELLGSIAQAAYVISATSGEAIKGWLEMYQDVEGLPRGESRKAGEQLTAYDQLVANTATAAQNTADEAAADEEEEQGIEEMQALWDKGHEGGSTWEDARRIGDAAKRTIERYADTIKTQFAASNTDESLVLQTLEDAKAAMDEYHADMVPVMAEMKNDQIRLAELTAERRAEDPEDTGEPTSSYTPEERRDVWRDIIIWNMWKQFTGALDPVWSEKPLDSNGTSIENVSVWMDGQGLSGAGPHDHYTSASKYATPSENDTAWNTMNSMPGGYPGVP